MGHSSASFLPPLIAGGLKQPDPHPAEDWEQLLPIQHAASLAQGIPHSLLPVRWDALPTAASPWIRASQALCSLSQLPRAGDGGLLSHLHPPPACYPTPAPTGKPHSSAQGLEMLIFKEPPPCPPQESLDWVKSPCTRCNSCTSPYGITLGKAG